ncbi:MAG: circularly permuted type 2 ATP-grasp protein [Puniceicoccaceae bacterium]
MHPRTPNELTPLYGQSINHFSDLYSGAELERRLVRLERASEEIGAMLGLQQTGGNRPIRIDPVPLFLDESTWNSMQRAIQQRAKVLAAFVRDVYDEQIAFREGVVASEIILSNPSFLRSMVKIPAQEPHAMMMSFDLLCRADGSWVFTENHLAFPDGLALTTIVRRAQAQAFPELFNRFSVEPVAEFVGRWTEVLRVSARVSAPRVVLLGEPSGGNLFEEGFLARQMGISLVTATDLVVRDRGVWVKTVSGLEKVDVILRAISSQRIDPVAEEQDALAGLPGLLHCLRSQTVQVWNLPGAEVANDLRLLPSAAGLTRLYLNEAPVFPTLRTFDAGDPDQAAWMESNLEGLALRPARSVRQGRSAIFPFGELECRVTRLRESGAEGAPTVGYRRFPLLEVAKGLGAERGRGSFVLRLFAMVGSGEPLVQSGGLCRLIEPVPSGEYQYTGEVKDVWVFESAATESASLRLKLESDLTVVSGSTPSRVAESMYWAARYAERAGVAAFRLRLLESIQWAELSPAEMKVYWPLWRATAAAAGSLGIRKMRKLPKELGKLSLRLLDGRGESSILSALRSALSNLQSVSDYVSPEALRVVTNVVRGMERKVAGDGIDELSILDCAETISDAHSLFLGTLDRSMAKDSGMRFFQVGICLERIYGLGEFLDHLLPAAVPLVRRHLDDDTDLTAVLRLLASLDLYRREYRSRAFLDRLLVLLWKHPAAPVSFRSNLEGMKEELERLELLEESGRGSVVQRHLLEAIERVDRMDFGKIFPDRLRGEDAVDLTDLAPSRRSLERLRSELRWMGRKVSEIHQAVEDTYFNHL